MDQAGRGGKQCLLCTVAAVSRNLPRLYPYLFTNRSDAILTAKGLSFSEVSVLSLATTKAREHAASSKKADRGKMGKAWNRDVP